MLVFWQQLMKHLFKQFCNETYFKFFNLYLDTINHCHELSFESIATSLEHLKTNIPIKESEQSNWQLFSNIIARLLEPQRNIGKEWSFTIEQIKLLSNYFSANALFFECLELATVSDREVIKNNLFLPPTNIAN
jgi:hypothetical protein